MRKRESVWQRPPESESGGELKVSVVTPSVETEATRATGNRLVELLLRIARRNHETQTDKKDAA